MKNYTSCFLGIPLPEEFMTKFVTVLHTVKTTVPSIHLVRPETPHITLYYLDKQSQYSLAEITHTIQPCTRLLNGTVVTIGGLGYFTESNPRIVFLNIAYPDSLRAFRDKATEVLQKYYALDNDFSFHPHLTLGRMQDSATKVRFKEKEQELVPMLDTVHWSFTVKEIVLYGVDSTKSPEFQERLLAIPV